MFSDEALVSRYAETNNANALGAIYERYSPSLIQSAENWLKGNTRLSIELAQDVIQDVFLNFTPEKAATVQQLGNYLWRSMYNRLKYAVEHEGYRVTQDIDDLWGTSSEPIASPCDPECAEADIELVQQILTRLDPEDRRIVQMIYFEGRTAVEVAKDEGIHVNCLYQRLHRAFERVSAAA